MAKLFSLLFKTKFSPKIGLGLGGGGAKGGVHLGALRAFEEEGISFDVVAGTSIGSIIGGLYARGYTWKEMEAIITNCDFSDAKKLLVARLTGQGVDGMLATVLGAMDFSELKIPFAAVAVDLAGGEKVEFKEGNLVKAMGASSAIPPYFAPVTVDGKRYLDGAYRNIIPCDTVKNMGADFVVGIDLSGRRSSTAQGKRLIDEMYPDNGVPVCNPTEDGYAACDVMIAPDISAYSSTDFTAIPKLFEIGYFAAKEKMPEILKGLKSLGVKLKKGN